MGDTHFQGRVIDSADNPALASGDITLTGWGTSPSVALASGSKDSRGRVQVTAGTTPGADPTVQVTFKEKFKDKNGADLIPFVVVSRGENVAPAAGYWSVSARAAASFTAKFVGTPVASSVYNLDYVVTA